MAFLDIFRSKKSAVQEDEPVQEEYVLPELTPLPGLSSLAAESLLADRRKQEEDKRKYGIKRVSAGRI